MTLELFPEEKPSPLFFEEQARRRGFSSIAGIDEVGRGPLAGPVVAAAVVLPGDFELPGLTDSKKLSERQRETLLPQIRRQALGIGVGLVDARRIDEVNILQATLQAMQLAISRLRGGCDFLLVDGITPIPTSLPQKTLKKGDSRSLSIAAASVVAKVVRDRMMVGYHCRYPDYGFDRHKGYGSAAHLQSIARCGPCPIHRRSFGGVREHLEAL